MNSACNVVYKSDFSLQVLYHFASVRRLLKSMWRYRKFQVFFDDCILTLIKREVGLSLEHFRLYNNFVTFQHLDLLGVMQHHGRWVKPSDLREK